MPKNLAELVAQLEQDIAFGRRRPRERLVEDDIVDQSGAKKHVVREALAELERMGLVERKRNKGAIVRDYTPEDVRQIYAVRELLETEAAKQIPLPASDELIEALEEAQAPHDEAVDTGNLQQAFRANLRFHQVLFGACGNSYLAEAVNHFALKTHGVRFYSLAKPELLTKARDEHRAIIDALVDGDRDRLVSICSEHLQPSAQAYINAYEAMFGYQARAQS